MRARFFNAVSGFVTGFMTGCLAAEDLSGRPDQLLQDRLNYLILLGMRSTFSVYMTEYVRAEFTGGDKLEAYLGNNLGFLLGYSYMQNVQTAKLEGNPPRWWRSGPR